MSGFLQPRAIARETFVLGICIPGGLAAYRVVIGGLRNSPFFNAERARPVTAFATDPTLWVTASVCTLAGALLFALVLLERRRGHRLTAGIVYGVLGAIVATFNWYVLSV